MSRRITTPSDHAGLDALLGRAFRLRRRGEHRRAMLTLRLACHRSEHDARVWTQYGVQCARMGRTDDALQALRQAVWLRERSKDRARVRVTRALIDGLSRGGEFPLRAA